MSLSEFQASKVAANPADPNLSPFLSDQLLQFFTRFSFVYVAPNLSNYDSSLLSSNSPLLTTLFGTPASAHRFVNFSIFLSMHYICYWPQEKDVVNSSNALLLAVCKGSGTRKLLASSESWSKLAGLFIVAGSLSNVGATPPIDGGVLAKHGLDVGLVTGFKRLNYDARAEVLSILTCGTGGLNDGVSKSILSESLNVAHGVLRGLHAALQGKLTGGALDRGSEPALFDLCSIAVELHGGICRSPFAGIVEAEEEDFELEGDGSSEAYVLTRFITPSLLDLASLMEIFGNSMSICNALLRCFKDYAELYIAFLNTSEATALYVASSKLLESYCKIRTSASASGGARGADAEEDEEQQYIDVLCAVQLLNHLGTKDFIDCVDVGSNSKNVLGSSAGGQQQKVDPTDVIFFGIAKLLPLVSDLLQYPVLCSQFFELVGYVVDNYPEKLNSVPADFFESLVGSLLWGMANVDVIVGKNCLRAIEALAKEQVTNGSLTAVLGQRPDTFKVCVAKLLTEVIFVHSVVFDRIDSAGGCLMVLIASDLNHFTTYVRGLIGSMGGGEHSQSQQQQLMLAFESLVNLETIQSGLSGRGLAGRNARSLFKKNFELFVKNVHSFMTCL